MRLRYVFIIEAIVCIGSLLVGHRTGRQSVYSEHWSEGYTACMTTIVETLATTDEIRFGNLVISEPNSTVTMSNVTFFVVDANRYAVEVDANRYAVEVDANDTTVMGGHFSF